MFDEVNVDEHPALADLRAGYLPGASLLLQRHRMDVQEGGRCLQIECIHGECLLTCIATNASDPDTPR